MRSVLFPWRGLSLALLGAVLCAPAGCRRAVPEVRADESGDDGSKGVYYAAPNKLYDRDVKFDIRWKVTHAPMTDTFDPATNVDNRTLAINRCDRCHECGFRDAFDLKNYNTTKWKPRIKGQDWLPSIYRMQDKNNAFLNEVIMERIYSFLRDETTVGYDEAKDKKGAVEVQIDEQGNPVKHERAKTPQKGNSEK